MVWDHRQDTHANWLHSWHKCLAFTALFCSPYCAFFFLDCHCNFVLVLLHFSWFWFFDKFQVEKLWIFIRYWWKMLHFSYWSMAFNLLRVDLCFRYWSSIYFLPNLLTVVMYIIALTMFKGKKKHVSDTSVTGSTYVSPENTKKVE